MCGIEHSIQGGANVLQVERDQHITVLFKHRTPDTLESSFDHCQEPIIFSFKPCPGTALLPIHPQYVERGSLCLAPGGTNVPYSLAPNVLSLPGPPNHTTIHWGPQEEFINQLSLFHRILVA